MAYQFIHIEAVSRAGRKTSSGQISVDSVLGEAGREDGFHDHVENSMEPVILWGTNVKDVRKAVENWAEGTKDSRGHKVRKDGNCLLSGVVSAPPDWTDEQRTKFEDELMDWLKVEYGSNLKLVLRHDDEPFHGAHAGQIHYQWHFFCVNAPGEKFNCHPGWAARRAVDTAGRRASKKEKQESLGNGIKAYKAAMIDFQERFRELGVKHDLERFGPRRLRRTRAEQKEVEKIVQADLDRARETEKKAEQTFAEALTSKTEGQKFLSEKRAELEQRERKIAVREIELEKQLTDTKKTQEIYHGWLRTFTEETKKKTKPERIIAAITREMEVASLNKIETPYVWGAFFRDLPEFVKQKIGEVRTALKARTSKQPQPQVITSEKKPKRGP